MFSRKTGYKLLNRYREEGPLALCDRSRRPVRYANQLPEQVERLILDTKRDKPHWGARKIRELLVRRLAGDVRVPATSTIHAVMDRRGLVRRRGRRRRNKAQGTPLSAGLYPNDLWCTDFKGEFKLGNRRYCYPLTVTDHASRRIMMCEALDSTREAPVIAVFARLFAEHGLPCAIRSDNGLPFASPNGLSNLSKLSRLVAQARHRHRAHQTRTSAAERSARTHASDPQTGNRATASQNSLAQQECFDRFRHAFNTERPHEALAMKCPNQVYTISPRPYRGLPEVDDPFPDRDSLVTACGRICMHRKKINISTVMAGQKLGLKKVDDAIWLVSFMTYDLGYIDLEQRTLQTIDNPFGNRLSPMS